jgi:hypothetical protein
LCKYILYSVNYATVGTSCFIFNQAHCTAILLEKQMVILISNFTFI